jgi:hypothetical protein
MSGTTTKQRHRCKLEASVDVIIQAGGVHFRFSDDTFINMIKGSDDQILELIVDNCRDKIERNVIIIPSRNRPGQGLLGPGIRFHLRVIKKIKKAIIRGMIINKFV